MKLILQNVAVHSFKLENNLTKEGEIKLEIKVDCNTSVQNDNVTAVAKCTVTGAVSPDSGSLDIELVLNAIFQCDGEFDERESGKESLLQLHPYLRAYIAAFSGTAGLPPIHIPPISGDELNAKQE